MECIQSIALPPGSLVLDLPSGFGRHSFALATAGHRIIAVDLDVERVALLNLASQNRPKCEHIHCVVADAERPLPFRNESFDLIAIVHYYAEHCLALCEQMLRPEGFLVLETFDSRGQNWRALPRVGEVAHRLGSSFDLLILRERVTGPADDRAVVHALAKKRSHETRLGAEAA